MKKYAFKPYCNNFPELFQIERERIAALVESALAIEHVGSTAVPGLGGKGIIDIAIAAEKQDHEAVSKQLESLGYQFRQIHSTPERLFFRIDLPDPEEPMRRYHVHLTHLNSDDWKGFIQFRDTLRSHPEEAQKYAELKQRAALEADENGEIYRKLKEPLLKKILSIP